MGCLFCQHYDKRVGHLRRAHARHRRRQRHHNYALPNHVGHGSKLHLRRERHLRPHRARRRRVGGARFARPLFSAARLAAGAASRHPRGLERLVSFLAPEHRRPRRCRRGRARRRNLARQRRHLAARPQHAAHASGRALRVGPRQLAAVRRRRRAVLGQLVPLHLQRQQLSE
jgi:hypothetical protein